MHLCIRPDQTVALVHDRPQLPGRLDPSYKKIAGQESVRLHFTLSKPADRIIPSFETLMPKTHDDTHLLGAFQPLATVISPVIYMPNDAIGIGGKGLVPLRSRIEERASPFWISPRRFPSRVSKPWREGGTARRHGEICFCRPTYCKPTFM